MPMGNWRGPAAALGRVRGDLTVTTRTRGRHKAPLSGRRIVGYNPSLSVFAACVVVGVFVFAWVELASPPNEVSNLLNVLPVLCLLVTMLGLLGTCRIVVDPAGFIDVVNLFVVRRVPVGDVAQVQHTEGLVLRLVSGRRVGSIAYGSSLLGGLLHYPRSVQAARRIEAAVGGIEYRLPTSQQDTVTSELRGRALLGALAADVVLVVGTVVLNTVLTTAQH
jgi:hypothetical protein